MKITVIICTYNRCRMLARALTSLAISTLPDSTEWEALVVDNNSSDQTPEVAEDFCSRYPGRFRYIFERHQGKSHALNSGIREARGEILAFIDDDVRVEPTWLQNLTAALHNREWVGAGGRIVPEWSRSVPDWLSPGAWYALGPLVHFDLGDEAGQLAQNPFGANMAFRKEIFEKYGGFRTDLGPFAGSKDPQKSEDSEFGVRLLAAGERLRYEPSAIVYHHVPDHRIQKGYFMEWWFDKGRSDIRAYGIPPGAKHCVAGIPLYLFRNLAICTLKWVVAIDPSRRFSYKLGVWTNAGQVFECHRQSIETRRRAENCRA